MRRLTGCAVKPPTLGPGGRGGEKAKDHSDAKAADPNAALTFPAHWNEADVRGALYGFLGRVCAYCTVGLMHNDRGDVEHFRPKGAVEEDPNHSGYWWLAYSVENYFLACRVCNSSRKRDRFPLLDGGVRVDFATRVTMATESRALLHPVDDPIEEWIEPDLDEKLCPLKPRNGISAAERDRVSRTVTFFELNVNAQLVKERLEARGQALEALEAKQPLRAAALASRFAPYSLVAREVVLRSKEHKLLTAEEELKLHLAALARELDVALQIVALALGGEAVDNAKKTVEEVTWAFASLAAGLDAALKPVVQQFLVAQGLDAQVTPRVAQLA